MKTKLLWAAIVIMAVLLVGENQRVNRLTAQCSTLSSQLYPMTVEEDLSRYSDDELILYTLLEVFGERLDKAYNPANLEECPWEEGNWTHDVACEMDWPDLIRYIVDMPDFGTDYDYAMLNIITDNRWQDPLMSL